MNKFEWLLVGIALGIALALNWWRIKNWLFKSKLQQAGEKLNPPPRVPPTV